MARVKEDVSPISIDEPMYTPKEAAGLLRVPRWFLCDLISRGRIPVIEHSPRRRFITKAAIEEYLRSIQKSA